MYTQRKIGTRNIVGIYDWSFRENGHGCSNGDDRQWIANNGDHHLGSSNLNNGINLGHCCMYEQY